MNDTYGRSLPLPLMRFDQDTLSWRTCEDTSLWDLEMFSPSFPESGMTLDGELFELPIPERSMIEQGSSLLPTPTARDWKEQALGWTWERNGVRQEDTLPRALTALLLMPAVMDKGTNCTRKQPESESLTQEALSIGASTQGQFFDGSECSEDLPQIPLSPE